MSKKSIYRQLKFPFLYAIITYHENLSSILDSIYTSLYFSGYIPTCHLAAWSQQPAPNKSEGGCDLPNRTQNLGFHSPICYFRPGTRVRKANQNAYFSNNTGLLLLMLASWGQLGLLFRNSGLTFTGLSKLREGTL